MQVSSAGRAIRRGSQDRSLDPEEAGLGAGERDVRTTLRVKREFVANDIGIQTSLGSPSERGPSNFTGLAFDL